MDKQEVIEAKTPEETTEESPLKKDINQLKQMTVTEKFKFVKSNITVEPVLALFVMPSVLAILATQNLNLDKACRVNLGFDDAVCTALRLRKRANHTHEEDEIQKLIASVQAWKSVIHTAVPTILMLFIGAWSDKTGKRKICMLMPIVGEFLTCILNMINTYFFYEVSVEWTVFMEVVFPALTGGWYTMFLGTFSYLGDITSKETRTFRMGILNLCMTVGFPIGMGLSGVLLRSIGYYGVFTISASLQFINFCYVVFRIKDHTWLDNREKVNKSGCTGLLSDFFDVASLKETMEIVFRKGANNRRLRICLILAVVCLTFGPMWDYSELFDDALGRYAGGRSALPVRADAVPVYCRACPLPYSLRDQIDAELDSMLENGELSVMYIFMRYRFNWDEVRYSIYSTYNFVAHSLGTLFSISVFSRKLHVDDAVLGMVSTASKFSGSLVMAFARNDYEVYMCPLVEILNGTSAIALKSIASKLVSHKELGKVFSLFGVAETLMPLLFAPLYSRVYIATLHALPGTFMLLSAAATVPALGIFGWFYHQHKKDLKIKRQEVPMTPPVAGDPGAPMAPA